MSRINLRRGKMVEQVRFELTTQFPLAAELLFHIPLFEVCCVISDLHAVRSLLIHCSWPGASNGIRTRPICLEGRCAAATPWGHKNSQGGFPLWLSLFSYASFPISRRISRILSRSSRVSAFASISSSSCFSFSMHSCRETFMSRLLSADRVDR